MHNKFSLSVTLNAVKGLKKIPHCVRNDKFFVQFLDLLIYSLDQENASKMTLDNYCFSLQGY